ncbi:undecaprenyl-diphosphatase [Ferdinandcohnia sp. Marseille-Q9671]
MNMFDMNIELFHLINDKGKELSFLNPPMIIITEYLAFFLAFAVLVFWFKRDQPNRIMIISAGFAFIVAEILGKLAGQLHSHYQPFAVLEDVNQLIDKAIDNSFPSDHTILFFAFCFTFFLFNKKSRYFWMVLACLMGFSRIWVGVHYPVDVLVGAMIAMISATIFYVIVTRLSIIQRLLAIYEKYEQLVLPTKLKDKNL